MKKFLLILLAAVLCLGAVACSNTAPVSNKIILGTSADYPPFEFIILDDSGKQQYVGIDISLAQAIAEDQNKELVVMNMEFESLMAALQKGDVDIVIAAIEETPERLEAADFSTAFSIITLFCIKAKCPPVTFSPLILAVSPLPGSAVKSLTSSTGIILSAPY